MADLNLLQDRINLVPALLQEVAELRPASKTFGEPSFHIDDLQTLESHLNTWGAETASIIKEECGKDDAASFQKIWSDRRRTLSYKEAHVKRLNDSRSYLYTLISARKAQDAFTDIWSLVHPDIELAVKSKVADGKYAEAVERAVKVVVACGVDVEKYKGVLDLVRADEEMTMEEGIRKLVVLSEVMVKLIEE